MCEDEARPFSVVNFAAIFCDQTFSLFCRDVSGVQIHEL